MAEPVVIVPYDQEWPRIFIALRSRAAAAVGGLAVSVEHIGSTAVPGLSAKPVIDIVVVVAANDVRDSIERLVAIGYTHQGSLGVEGRDAFAPLAGDPPLTSSTIRRPSSSIAGPLYPRRVAVAAINRRCGHAHGSTRSSRLKRRRRSIAAGVGTTQATERLLLASHDHASHPARRLLGLSPYLKCGSGSAVELIDAKTSDGHCGSELVDASISCCVINAFGWAQCSADQYQ